jgi:hypothetical protein
MVRSTPPIMRTDDLDCRPEGYVVVRLTHDPSEAKYPIEQIIQRNVFEDLRRRCLQPLTCQLILSAPIE